MASRCHQGDLDIRDIFLRRSHLIGTTEAASDSYVELDGNIIKLSSTATTYENASGTGKWNLFLKRSTSLLNTAVDTPLVSADPTRFTIDTSLAVSQEMTLRSVSPHSVLRLDAQHNVVRVGGIHVVTTVGDLPSASGGVIGLASDTTYVFTAMIDLLGSRLVCGSNTTFQGQSVHTSGITSTGLVSGPLVSSCFSLCMQNLTVVTGSTAALDLDATTSPAGQAVDWYNVSFVDCGSIGTIRNYHRWSFTQGSCQNSAGLVLDGTMEAVLVSMSTFVGRGGQTVLDLSSTLVVSRRFCVMHSTFDIPVGGTGISVGSSESMVRKESFVVDSCCFDGSGTYMEGMSSSNQNALFTWNRGIPNRSPGGQLYLTAGGSQVLSEINTFTKITSVTTDAGPSNIKFDHANNRLTCRTGIPRRFMLMAHVSLIIPSGTTLEVGFYDSTVSGVRVPSRMRVTGADKTETLTLSCLSDLVDGDFIEVWYRFTAAEASTTTIITDAISMTITQA